MTDRPADQAARERALDPTRSFLVQAPAGSGKTGLLTQRYLALLARVQVPEEIVAITFTRKAAGEMRERVLAALRQARDEPPPADDYQRRLHALARTALDHAEQRGWQLLDNPARLRIFTFDALCLGLVRQMPLLSGFGVPPQITEQAGELYAEAAEAVLAELEEDDEASAGPAVATLLRHLDNRHDRVAPLIAAMLARRDQWLRHLMGRDDPRRQRAALEAALRQIVEAALARLRAALPAGLRDELLDLLRYAADHVDADRPLAAWRDATELPPADADHLPQWRALYDLLRTGKGEWRKQVTAAMGFPAPSGAKGAERARREAMKARMAELAAALREDPDVVAALEGMAVLPAPRYDEAQWAVLDALSEVLVRAVGHLEVTFRERGEADFSAIALAAVRALGEPDRPTDLALHLDYRIHHLLVDEFQDTSIQQFELLRRLTAGWTADDGRTLFLVGDPMQSIYRFREAEVGLFLEVKRRGLGELRPEFLQLQVNFRSRGGLIEWINAAFPQVFPAEDDERSGAVAYSPAVAWHPPEPGPAVRLLPFSRARRHEEAPAVVDAVRQALAADPAGSVAILVRGRGHLAHIAPALREAGIRYRAVEIDALADRPVVQDLLALARALLHPADRIAWLAVLRAPFCGLTRRDLVALAGGFEGVMAERLADPAAHAALSAEGRAILARVAPVLGEAVAQRGRFPLRDWVERTWLALGGPATCPGPVEREEATACLDLLEGLDEGGDVGDYAALAEAAASLFAPPDSGEDIRVELMTIHKAKGLEFDAVIVPGLGNPPRNEEKRLLYWEELPGEGGGALLLGPISAAGEKEGPTVEYLKALERARAAHEAQRLLYVAVTRARRRLWLSGHVSWRKGKGGGAWAPDPRSLLALLWPVVENEFVDALGEGPDEDDAPEEAPAATPAAMLRRLPPDWRCPAPPPGVAVPPAEPPLAAAEPVEYDWAGETARHVGTVVHRWLEHLARLDAASRAAFDIGQHRAHSRHLLAEAGVVASELDAAVTRVEQAVRDLLADPRGQWILSDQHQAARSEYPLSGVVDGAVRRYVVDRTFIDADGTRWIIDYKTGRHEGGDLDAFLDREQERYRPQLEQYARLFALREDRPIRLGLYFPLLRGWREWEFGG